eukprot:752698-Rhodomonas_salina.1
MPAGTSLLSPWSGAHYLSPRGDRAMCCMDDDQVTILNVVPYATPNFLAHNRQICGLAVLRQRSEGMGYGTGRSISGR